MAQDDGSIQASLGRLGLQVTSQQLVGVAVAVLAGWLVGRVLAFDFVINLYSHTVGRIQELLGLAQTTRDSFNKYAMAAVPFLTSFVISWVLCRGRR